MAKGCHGKTADELVLKLVKNPDILQDLGAKKREGQTLIGFAAETKNAMAYGRKKLFAKNLDGIVINSVNQKGIGFGSDDNEVVLLLRDQRIFKWAKTKKTKLAEKILCQLLRPSLLARAKS